MNSTHRVRLSGWPALIALTLFLVSLSPIGLLAQSARKGPAAEHIAKLEAQANDLVEKEEYFKADRL